MADMNQDELTPYSLRCRTCWGRGTVERWVCETCWDWYDFQTRCLSEGEDLPSMPTFYTARQLRRLPDPPHFLACGHRATIGQTLNAVMLDYQCPKCQGSRTRTIYLTPEQASTKREKKRKKDEDTKKCYLSAAGFKVPCGALTRDGDKCVQRCEKGMSKCKNHGGKSTGPRTAEGRQRVNEARWHKKRMQSATPTP